MRTSEVLFITIIIRELPEFDPENPIDWFWQVSTFVISTTGISESESFLMHLNPLDKSRI